MIAKTTSRKRHVQQQLFRRGGKRKRAGRKPKGSRAGSPHRKRPDFKSDHPLHVVMRVVAAVGSMRRRSMYKAVREATITAALRERFRITHVSIQRTHVHMLVEAENKHALARGMQGFQISAARHINTALGDKCRRRRGPVFTDRYHLTVIKSPTQARNAIGYVLSNFRKHREDREGLPSTWLVDPFSSGILFPDWTELDGKAVMWPWRDTYDPLIVRRPQGWLLAEGWKKAGPLSARTRWAIARRSTGSTARSPSLASRPASLIPKRCPPGSIAKQARPGSGCKAPPGFHS
jgi:putative transposase